MAIKTINELTALNEAGENDYLLISHKENDDSYTSQKILASALGGSGSSSGGSSGGAEILVVTFTTGESSDSITTTTPISDILIAVFSGKIVQARIVMSNDDDYAYGTLVDVGLDSVGFVFFLNDFSGDGSDAMVMHLRGLKLSENPAQPDDRWSSTTFLLQATPIGE